MKQKECGDIFLEKISLDFDTHFNPYTFVTRVIESVQNVVFNLKVTFFLLPGKS